MVDKKCALAWFGVQNRRNLVPSTLPLAKTSSQVQKMHFFVPELEEQILRATISIKRMKYQRRTGMKSTAIDLCYAAVHEPKTVQTLI
jgi:hypothetical protein